MATNIDFQDGLNFGSGFDTLTANVRGSAVTGDDPKTILGGGGSQITFALLRAESFADYQRSFCMHTDLSASFGLFHGSSGINFSSQSNFHTFSKYLVVAITVVNPFLQIPNPQLTKSARDLLAPGTPAAVEAFRQEFGDAFVLGVRMGGSFFASLEFTSKSASELESVANQLDNGVFGLFDASASFSKALKKTTGDLRVTINSTQTGGTDKSQKIAVDDIIAKALAFATEIGNNAVPISALLQDFGAIDAPAKPNAIDIENSQAVLKKYYTFRAGLIQALNNVNYIQLHPDEFVNPGSFNLAAKQIELEDQIDALKSSASACANDMSKCKFQTPPLGVIDLPERRAIDPDSFTGTWNNLDPSFALKQLVIFPANKQNATVSGIISGHIGAVSSLATWDADSKALSVSLFTVKGGPVGNKVLLSLRP